MLSVVGADGLLQTAAIIFRHEALKEKEEEMKLKAAKEAEKQKQREEKQKEVIMIGCFHTCFC